MSEHAGDPVVAAALREVRKSLSALLLELPEEVWRSHKGTVENAIAGMVEERLAVVAERDRLRSALAVLDDAAVIERLAEATHVGWMAHTAAQGVSSRLSVWGEEFMVPYAEMSERAKDLDRAALGGALAELRRVIDGRVRAVPAASG